MKKLFIALVLVLMLNWVSAVDYPQPKDKYVNDFANILSSEQASGLRSLLQGVEQSTTAEVVFVSIEDCGGDYDGYAVALASKWGVGKADKDNGLFELYCKNEKRFVIKTGYGLEGILPDSKIGRMLDDYYVPLRDSGNLSSGIVLFTNKITEIIEANKEDVISGQTKSKDMSGVVFYIIILLLFFVIPVILRRVFKKRLDKRKVRGTSSSFFDALLWFWIGNSLGRGSGGSSGGFGGGFSGGGFGGGGFGGGGASR